MMARRSGTSIRFLGGTGTVTGSRFLVETGGRKVLVDCGLFQGLKELRLRNREPFPIDPAEIDAVLLTHAHLDHSGWLPLLVRDGFRGPIHCTAATRDLCGILLRDSARLQEEEAEEANRRGYSKHHPALPLYTTEDAERALTRLEAVSWKERFDVAGRIEARFSPVGHILGAAMIHLHTSDGTILFSGDVGRPNDPILYAPDSPGEADWLLVESTYGDRDHERGDPAEPLAEIIRRTVDRGGSVVIPSFAVGRAQALLYHIGILRAQRRIPSVPVYLDSPMAAEATRILVRYIGEHRLSESQCVALSSSAHFVASAAESSALCRDREPRVIVSASGMATDDRILGHLAALAPDSRNTIVFAGFQAAGTRGARAVGGERSLKIQGQQVPLRAEIVSLPNLSAHADRSELLGWLDGLASPPKRTFITHGEPAAAEAFRTALAARPGWRPVVPDYLETVKLR